MDYFLSDLGSGSDYGLAWPGIVALAGVLLFVLLGVYAGLLLNSDRLPARLKPPHVSTLRGRLVLALTLVATLPAISLALVLSERASHQRVERGAIALQAQADNVAHSVDYLLEKSRWAIAGLATHIGRTADFTPAAMARWLRLYHQEHPEAGSVFAADYYGNLVAATVRLDGEVRPVSNPVMGRPGSDQLRRALDSGQPFVSAGVAAPFLGSGAAVLVSVPVRRPDGTPWGIVVSALDPASVSSLEGWLAGDRAPDLVITDEHRRVLYASQVSGFRPLDSLADSLMPAGVAGSGQPFGFERTSAAGETTPLIGAVSRLDNGWEVLRYRPTASLRAALLEEYAVAFGWLVAAVVVSLCLAIALSGGIAGPLQALDTAVRNFDMELDKKFPQPPLDAPREVGAIFEHLTKFVERLGSSYQELRQAVKQGERLRRELANVISNRETEIRNRTEELRQANATLERLSRVDTLTGTANRRSLAEFLERTWRTATRDQQPVSIAIVDIDHFKAYNEGRGHEKGDLCLKSVSETIRQVAGRASDLVSRYGGEEFVVVLGNTPLDGALQVAEQIRAAVASLAIPRPAGTEHAIVTVSVGVASTVPARHTAPESLLVAAERALHTAKELGRNQVAYSTAARTGLYQSLCLPNDVSSARPS